MRAANAFALIGLALGGCSFNLGSLTPSSDREAPPPLASARNIASLGGRCIFAGLIGDDDAGAKLRSALALEKNIESVLVCDPWRPTTRKVRFVSEHFSTHMLRADWEKAQPATGDVEQKLIDAILPLLARADKVIE